MALLEVENDGLQEVLDANFAILLDQVDKSFLIGFPSLHNVVLLARVEAGAEEDPVAEFGRETLRGRDQLQLVENRINLPCVFKDESVQL